MGRPSDLPILHEERAPGSLGLPLGELVPKRALGIMGTLGPRNDTSAEDNHDTRKPVSHTSKYH